MQDHVRTHAPSGTLVPVGRLRPANGLSGFTGRVYFSRDMKFQANNQNPIPKPGQPVFLWFLAAELSGTNPNRSSDKRPNPTPRPSGRATSDERRTRVGPRIVELSKVHDADRGVTDRRPSRPAAYSIERCENCFLPIEISVAGFGLPGGGVVIALVSLPSSSMTRSNVARPSRASVNVSERVPVQSAATV